MTSVLEIATSVEEEDCDEVTAVMGDGGESGGDGDVVGATGGK